jgi:hypothetical protein
MKIVEMNTGEKVSYSLKKNMLTLNDEITISLDKYQRDYEVVKDVMADGDGALVIGTGRYYVAQIVIPASEYDEEVVEASEATSDNGQASESISRTKKPLNTDDVELRLFTIEGVLN